MIEDVGPFPVFALVERAHQILENQDQFFDAPLFEFIHSVSIVPNPAKKIQ